MMIKRQSGFSLLELALGLFILGFLFALMPMMISSLGQLQSADPAANPLDSGEQALVGFVIQHNRLPCPDTTNDGIENCNGAKTGGFPYRTVNLGRPLVNAAGFALHYGVYQHSLANLSALQSSYQPSLLSNSAYISPKNGLDFCQGLRLGQTAGLQNTEFSVRGLNSTNHVNSAFILVDPGPLDADIDGRAFDGLNAQGLIFESAAKAQADDYDDTVRAVSFNQLSARLQCPELLARVSAATRDANAAYDMWRSYSFFRKFREFNVDVRTVARNMSKTKRDFAIANGAISGAMVVSDTASALSGPGGAIATAVYFVNTVTTIALIVEELEGAIEDLGEKNDELELAKEQKNNAVAAEAQANIYRIKAQTEAQNRDAKGWFQ